MAEPKRRREEEEEEEEEEKEEEGEKKEEKDDDDEEEEEEAEEEEAEEEAPPGDRCSFHSSAWSSPVASTQLRLELAAPPALPPRDTLSKQRLEPAEQLRSEPPTAPPGALGPFHSSA